MNWDFCISTEWKTEEVFHPAIEKRFFEAVVNFWLMGWNDRTDKELYTLEELVEAFDLEYIKQEQNLIGKKQMVQSPTFDQTKRRRFGIPSLYRCFKGLVPENVLIKLFP
jgi:hypothetical protein